MSNSVSSNRSGLKEFIASISAIRGDLSNITAPPFLLASNSTVELPQYWADHPHLFVAPASEPKPAKRALLVLKWFIGSLRNQQYAGRTENEGVKKPLNAFLGKVFLGSFADESIGETRLVAEQVSHHPPVTACYLWNEKCGVRAEGFACQEITFGGSVSIKQKGYAILHVDKFDEDYLIPLPEVKVKGVLTGTPYPELTGVYRLVCSSGYVAEIEFEGKGLLGGGNKNGFEAKIFHTDAPSQVLYSVHGTWNNEFTVHDTAADVDIETYHVMTEPTAHITVPPTSQQDPWESRCAWAVVLSALESSNMQGVVDAKTKIEQGQRDMREAEEKSGSAFSTMFFSRVAQIPAYDRLSGIIDTYTEIEPEGGMWKVDHDTAAAPRRPFHGDLRPDNTQPREATGNGTGEGEQQATGSATHQPGPPKKPARQPEISEGTQSPSQPQSSVAEDLGGEIKRSQVEAFLRNKYSSSNK